MQLVEPRNVLRFIKLKFTLSHDSAIVQYYSDVGHVTHNTYLKRQFIFVYTVSWRRQSSQSIVDVT